MAPNPSNRSGNTPPRRQGVTNTPTRGQAGLFACAGRAVFIRRSLA